MANLLHALWRTSCKLAIKHFVFHWDITRIADYISFILLYHTFTRKYVHFAYVTNMTFNHISVLWSAKGVIMGHVGDTAFLPGQKTHITRSRG